MTADKHNPYHDLPEALWSQEAIREATEEALRDAVELLIGESVAMDSHAAIRTAAVMAHLAVKYETQGMGENKSQFTLRRIDIMATAVKAKLNKELGAAKEQRKVVAAKAAAAEKPAKAPKAAAAEGEQVKRGRSAAINKIKINPEGGESKLNATSERAAVLEMIKKAGAKGITIEALDEQLGKPSRPFVLKLLEKSWVIVLS